MGLHAPKQTEPLPWGSRGFIPDRGWCFEENQRRAHASGQREQRMGCGGGCWGRVSAKITPAGKDSRQGSSVCHSPRARKRGHARVSRRKHRGRERKLDGTRKPQDLCPHAGPRGLPG